MCYWGEFIVYFEHLPCSSSGSCSLKKLYSALFQAPDVKYFSQDKKIITVPNNTLKRGYHFILFLGKKYQVPVYLD